MGIETEVALLKSDVTRMTSVFEKLDLAIEKMGAVSNDIARMLAVHEERLNKHQELDEELFSLVENRRQEIQVDIKELHSRITTVTRELSNDISETEQRLMSAMNHNMDEIKKCITEESKTVDKEQFSLEARITELERWKWLVMGGSVVLGALSHEVIGTLFK
jgi:hypothetical protein